MSKFNRIARIALLVLVVIAFMLPMVACGGEGNGVEKAVSGGISDVLDSQFQPGGSCPVNCDCGGIVQVCQ